MFKNYNSLCDVVSLLAYCPQDFTCLLQKELTGEYGIPQRKNDKSSWKLCASRMISELFGSQYAKSIIEPLQVTKVWLPNHKTTYIYHVVYKLAVKMPDKRLVNNKPPTTANRLVWLEPAALQLQMSRMAYRTPEITHWLQMLLGDAVLPKEFDLMLCRRTGASEPEPSHFLVEYCEECIVMESGPALSRNSSVSVVSNSPSASANSLLVQAAGYTKEDQLRVYREFLVMVFPALYMSPHVFCQFLLDLGWQKQQCPALFRAADVNARGGLSFWELLLWTAALEPCTEHRGTPAELRCRYIFRYFDTNRDLSLEYSEFQDFVATTRAARLLPTDSLSVTKEADDCLRQLDLQPNSTIGLNDFLRGVFELTIRGTSTLLRAPRSIIGYIADLQTERDKEVRVQSRGRNNKPSGPQPQATTARDQALDEAAAPPASPVPLPSTETPVVVGGGGRGRRMTATAARTDYSMAAYTVRLTQFDTPKEMLQIKEFNFETVSPSTVKLIMPAGVAPSVEILGPESLPVETLAAIHYFATDVDIRRMSDGTRASVGSGLAGKRAWSWATPAEEARLGTLLLRLAESTKPIFEQEPRLLKLNSPIYAIGDLHGNLRALLDIEKTLWPYGVALSPATIIFLGDYVDRGIHGSELMAYLLAVKLQRPAGVALIRGNHETRDIQKMFTFYNECISKYGEFEGNKIWNAVNNVFDALPLAAVVDEKVFCCHGGIPPPWVCPLVSGIERVPVPLPRPAEQSTIAWELLWNDPITPTKITGSLALELAKNEGFASNPKRGTGHVFDQIALDRFLLANHLSHVVRAHELHQHGFMMQMRGRLISVFSSSHYCGGNNDSGVAFLDGGKVRIIRVTPPESARSTSHEPDERSK